MRLGLQFCGELIEEAPYRLDTPLLDRRDTHAADTGAPWLMVTSTHALHVTSRRVSLS